MTYRHGKYEVEVAPDGAIKVKPGDSLGRYALAMFDSLGKVQEFGRLGKLGMERITNPRSLRAGETIYYIPMYVQRNGAGGRGGGEPPPMTEDQRRDLVETILSQDFDLKGENWKKFHESLEWYERVEHGASCVELLGVIGEGWLASTLLGLASGFGAGIVFPLKTSFDFVNALQGGLRDVGMVAVAYTVTAWAFGDPVPGLSRQARRNVLRNSPQQLPAYEKAWRDASQSAVNGLNGTVAKSEWIKKESYQAALRACGLGSRQKLASAVLKRFEGEGKHFWDRMATWETAILDSYQYPN